MNILAPMFIIMAIYGVITGAYAISVLLLIVATISHQGNKSFEKRESEWNSDSRNAPTMKDNTIEILDRSECTGHTPKPNSPNEKSKPDLEI